VIVRFVADGSSSTFFRDRSNLFDILVAKVTVARQSFAFSLRATSSCAVSRRAAACPPALRSPPPSAALCARCLPCSSRVLEPSCAG